MNILEELEKVNQELEKNTFHTIDELMILGKKRSELFEKLQNFLKKNEKNFNDLWNEKTKSVFKNMAEVN